MAAGIIVITFVVSACDDAASDRSTIRVSVLPDQSPAALRGRFLPLLEYINRETGLDTEFLQFDDYEQFSSAFQAGEIDLAWFGGLTFVRAQQSAAAVPLVQRDIDVRFVSQFIVAGDSEATTIEDLEGMPVAFGPRLSTSGHLMPRHFLVVRQMLPEHFFSSVSHTSGHDQTAFAVRDGKVALGAVNDVIVSAMFDDGRLGPGSVRVLETTPPYANYVWAVSTHLPEPRVRALRDAFLALDRSQPEQRRILELQGAEFFIPANPKKYDGLRAAAISAGLLPSAAQQ